MYASQKKPRLLVIIDERTKNKFRLKAIKNRRTMSQVLIELIEKWVNEK